MSDYVTVNCMESCPRCKHKIRMEYAGIDADYHTPRYLLDCDYIKNIILNPNTKCSGMFEPREDC